MGKKVKFNLDFVISDDKKELALKETENTELVASNNGNTIIPRGTKRKRRKKL